MENKNMWAIIVIFILIAIVRVIGVENIPFTVVFSILVLCILTMFLGFIKYKATKKERIYLLSVIVLASLLITTILLSIYMEDNWVQAWKQYEFISTVLIGVLFVSLLIIVYAGVICKYKKKK